MTTILWDQVQGHSTRPLPMECPMAVRALRAVSDMTGIAVDILIDPTHRHRARHITRPRQMVMILLRDHNPQIYSLPRIGQILGGRDHTTVRCGLNRIAKLEREDDAMKAAMAVLRERLGIRRPE